MAYEEHFGDSARDRMNATPQPLAAALPVVERRLREDNIWWRGERRFGIPPIRRWAFEPMRRGLLDGLTPAVVLRGPRQIGKTTLLNQLIDSLQLEGIDPRRILRVQFDELPALTAFDDPILSLVQWFAQNVLGQSLNQAAHDGRQALIFLDEVQNLPNWAPQLKHLVDTQPVRVVVTGSSALRIEAGRDSLAGRISTLDMGPLFLREIGEFQKLGVLKPYLPFNGLGPLKDVNWWRELKAFGEAHAAFRREAFAAFSARGAYPMAQSQVNQAWEAVADALNETVIRRAIQHDLRMGPRGQKRDGQLLEEVFRMACRYAGQAPAHTLYLREIKQIMNADIGWRRIDNYLRFLDGTLLLRMIAPLELRLKRPRGAPKICLCDHALRAAWLQEVIPLTPAGLELHPHLSDLAGRIAESAAGYFLASITGLDVAHFPPRSNEPEVDYILTIGEQRIPLEIKYRRRIDRADTHGLRNFMERPVYNAPFGVLVTLEDQSVVDDPRIICLPLSTLLLMR
jgi:predicted AAA+ superfamily ATPase